ncbi:MAG: cytochrome C biogenesis protein [Gammaproteobacteria bacterium]|nr:MAG: cytochrome C biogenesis protein [Gammaproteobacteria bacterium]
MNIASVSALAIVLYLIAAGLLSVRLTQRVNTRLVKGLAIALGLGAVALHGWVLSSNVIITQGLNLGFFNALSLVTGLMALLLLAASILKPLESLGIGLLPLAALALLLENMFPSRHIILQEGMHGLDVHILISILAASVLSVAAVQAALFAIQDTHLRDKHPGGFIRALPPLQSMEALLFQMIALGFALLSLALLTGALYIKDIFSQHLVHKTTLSILAWIVFGVLLWGRRRYGWRGRTAIRWTLTGFFVLMLAYFGSKLVLELVLQR